MRRLTAAGVVVALLLGACAKSETVSVQMDEFTIGVDPVSVPTGARTFEIANLGSVRHEFVLLRTSRAPDSLQVKGGVARVRSPGVDVVKQVPRIDPGESRSTTVRLARGRFVVICNIAGHYASGMYSALRVG